MSAKETLNATVETVAQSLIQAPASHSAALASMGTGALTGSLVLQVLAGAVSLALLIKTGQDIWLNSRRIKNEKKDPL